MKTIWYFDDENVKHYTVVKTEWELRFFKDRFDLVGEIKSA